METAVAGWSGYNLPAPHLHECITIVVAILPPEAFMCTVSQSYLEHLKRLPSRGVH